MTDSMDDEILLVEDSQSDVELFDLAIDESDLDGELRTASTGEEALSIIDAESIDLIILDIDLPGKSGIEVLSDLHTEAEPATTPILMFSSNDNEAKIQKAYELGANAYIVKRMDFEDTVSLVDALNDFWLETAELPE